MPARAIPWLLALLLALGPAPGTAQTAVEATLRAGMAAVRSGDEARLAAAIEVAADPVVRDVLLWHRLRARQGTFDEGEAFLERNPGWPGLPLLRQRLEPRLPDAPDRVIAFFDDAPPATSSGALALARALAATGRATEAEIVAIDAWLTMPTAETTEAGFLAAFGDLLRPFDAARLDAMAWAGETASAERALARLGGPEAALGRARVVLREGRDGADGVVAAVPEALRDAPGLAYERFRWRLERGLTDGALELLFANDADADALGRPEAWAGHRERLARGLMQDGRHAEAYRVAARHHMPPAGEDLASLEWIAGYLALRFLDRPGDAATHFAAFDEEVVSPISRGRAGYWLGRALEASGDIEGAGAAYARGALWQTSFYGQLAAERAGLPSDPLLAGRETFPPAATAAFADGSVLAAARALHAAGERDLAERFLTHLAETLPRVDVGSLIDLALDELDDPHIALLIAKRAAQSGHELHRGYFPVTPLARQAGGVAPELALSIARRESEFDPVVVSRAGAAGLMQVMPGTAREMAQAIGEPYRQSALTSDPDYNARLGTAYLRLLEREFDRSPILVPAAYNAGPSRARRWRRELGDPSDPLGRPRGLDRGRALRGDAQLHHARLREPAALSRPPDRGGRAAAARPVAARGLRRARALARGARRLGPPPPQGEQPRGDHDGRADHDVRPHPLAEHGEADRRREDELEVGEGLHDARLGHLVAAYQEPVARRTGDAERRHPAPVDRAHRLPRPDPDDRDRHRPDRAGPEEARRGGVRPPDVAGEQAVEGEHERGRQRDQRGRGEHRHARPQDHQDADEARADGGPAAPADPLAQHRPRQRRDEERIGGEDRMRLHEA